MAIGTALAIGLGGAALSAGGSMLSASSQKKAAGKAADSQLAATESNNALQRDIYGQNKAALSPFMDRGNTAGSYLNAFMGLPSAQPMPQGGTMGGEPDYAAYVRANPDIMAEFNEESQYFGGDPAKFGQFHWQKYGQNEGRSLTPTAPNGQAGAAPAVTMGDANNAFGNYIANSDYGFQFGTGTNALNSGYAGSGSLQSGAAMKGLEKYRQNLQAGYRNEYTGLLGQQQAVGAGAASSLAGVGQNYAAAVGANTQSGADALSNAALIKGQNNPFGNALGILGGSLIGIGGR